MNKINKAKKFNGNIKEFIVLCQKWLNTFVIGKKDFIPNERLIRGYVSEDILPRPERKGKESFYNYKHLIYFLVCRDLFSENWPLAKISEYFKNINFEELELNFLKKYDQVSSNDSLEVIGELKKSSLDSIKNTKTQNINTNYSKNLMLRSYQNSQQSIKEFGSDLPSVLKDEFTTYTLASWLSVAIKTKKLSEMDSDLAFRISNAVKSAFLETNLKENTNMFENIKQTTEVDQKNQQLEREINTLKTDNSLLENKLKYNEHNSHLRDLEMQKIEDLFHEKEKSFSLEFEKNSKIYEEKIKDLQLKTEIDKQEIELSLKKEIENLNYEYEIKLKEQKKQYEENILELKKHIKAEK